jgi:hypothetical protein
MSGSEFPLIFLVLVTTSMIPDFLVDLSTGSKLLDLTLSKLKLLRMLNTITPERDFQLILITPVSIILALILSDKILDGLFPRKTSLPLLMLLR